MSSSHSSSAEVRGEEEPGVATQPVLARSTNLRWWPALLLLVAMGSLRLLPVFWETPSVPVVTLAFLGPAAIGLLLLVWWWFASLATLREKLLGTAALGLVGGIAIALAHESMRGVFAVLFQVPAGLAAFALPLVLLARRPRVRLASAVVCALIGFGVWDLLRLHGTTGRFDPEFDWRWQPSPEELYLRSIAEGTDEANPSESVAEAIRRDDAEWPEFRGRFRDGVVPGSRLAEDWRSSPPKLVWKTRIGPGWSSFSVAGNRIFTQEQRGESEAVVCLDADTGKTLWSHVDPDRFWEAIGGAGPRATPTLGDDQLFAMGANGKLSALNPQSGELLWQRDLRVDAGREPPTWGWSSSPLLIGKHVLVHAGGDEDRGIIAYETATGEIVWQVGSGDHSYSSPHFATLSGSPGVLMITNTGIQFLSPEEGSTLWEHSFPVNGYRTVQPLVHDQMVLLGSGDGVGTRRLDVALDDDGWVIREAWTTRDMKAEFNDYVTYEGHLYGFDGSILACVDLESGTRQWKRGRYGNGQLLLLEEDGHLLVTTERGEVVFVKATPERLIELAKFPAIEGKTWNHPVLLGNRLFLRNGQEAACYELPAAEARSEAAPANLER